MIGYVFELTCPGCGCGVVPVAEGRPMAGTEVSAVARCPRCDREFHVHVILRCIGKRESRTEEKRQRNTERQRERRARLKAAT